jgi:hypothetical protein
MSKDDRFEYRIPLLMTGVPDGLVLRRNRDLAGRRRHPAYRRAALVGIAAIPALALLNVFGQKPTTTTASAGPASLSITAPDRLRGGLIFQVRATVVAHALIHSLNLVFDPGWWESMSVNSIEPQPTTETSTNGKVVLGYGKLPAGQKFVAWLYFQVNPTNVGDRREDVWADDGATVLVHLHRSLTIFP